MIRTQTDGPRLPGVRTSFLFGEAGDDTIIGGEGDGVLLGDSYEFRDDDGNDNITGGSGSERISGGGGADSIDGGFGDDTIYGALSQEELRPTGAELVWGYEFAAFTDGAADTVVAGGGND